MRDGPALQPNNNKAAVGPLGQRGAGREKRLQRLCRLRPIHTCSLVGSV